MTDAGSRSPNLRVTIPAHLLVRLHSVKLLEGVAISDIVEEAVRWHLRNLLTGAGSGAPEGPLLAQEEAP